MDEPVGIALAMPIDNQAKSHSKVQVHSVTLMFSEVTVNKNGYTNI
jgi:hypothetical protein